MQIISFPSSARPGRGEFVTPLKPLVHPRGEFRMSPIIAGRHHFSAVYPPHPVRLQFKVFRLRSETLVRISFLNSETLDEKIAKVLLRFQTLGVRARQPGLLLRFPIMALLRSPRAEGSSPLRPVSLLGEFGRVQEGGGGTKVPWDVGRRSFYRVFHVSLVFLR